MRLRTSAALLVAGAFSVAVAVAAAPAPAVAADPAPVPGFDGIVIRVGELQPLTGPAANFGLASANGAKAWFEYINQEKGGIAGRYKIETVIEDNANDQTMTVQSYNKIKDRIAMMAMLFGTHTTLAVLPQIREDNLLTSVQAADLRFFREKQLLPVGATYEVMAINTVDYLVREGGAQGKNFCAMTRDDPYGEAGLAGLKFAAEKLNLNMPVVTHFALSDQDFSGQVAQLKAANCDYVFITTIPPQLVRMVGNAVRVGYAPMLIAQFPSWTGTLVGSPAIDFFEKHLLIAGEAVEWGDTSSPQMVQMLDHLKKYTPDQKPDFFYIMGYRCAMAATEVLEKAAAAGDLSRKALVNALEGIKAMNFGGLGGEHRYGAVSERQPPRASSVFKINRKKPYGEEGVKVNFSSPTALLFEAK
jgi:ABC-type branched-subunit amino acid transport system substrate-binding protein